MEIFSSPQTNPFNASHPFGSSLLRSFSIEQDQFSARNTSFSTCNPVTKALPISLRFNQPPKVHVNTQPNKPNKVEDVLQQSKQFIKESKPKEASQLLESIIEKDSKDPNVLCQLSKACFKVSEVNSKDESWRKEWLLRGKEAAERAIEIAPDNYATHKWWAFNASALTPFQTVQEKVENVKKIKEAALKARELKPDDAATHYLLGRWEYNVASVGWFERRAAGLPSSTYQDALPHFLKAAEIKKNMLRNSVFLGKTYAAMDDAENANQWYQKALKNPVKNQIDQEMMNEARENSLINKE
eukprot:TRINITY_DN4105_c0_g1_i4.p1 TRINITY_DN4105_c0_g1~~TRINITY_DN4105_c0_g1_i4.p1  ORF type:complete len:300 (-),score=100.04 TRINITY_DN4105_c0_g1_i4:131-1030(-)